MSALSPNISIIILNINGPNIPIKKETEWQSGLKKKSPKYMLSTRNSFQI